jgi:Domain of unknown function (DUF4382)
VKRLSAAPRILALVGPLLLVAALIAGPFGCGGGGGGGATPVPAMGSLEVGFVDSPSTGYQSISVNVVSVRLNPSTNADVPDSDPNWVSVTAPPGTGSTSTAELSINLLDFQNDAAVFNTGAVTAQTYNQVEVIIDPNFPGSVTPSCGSGAQEGCVDYPAVFTGTTNLRTTATVSVSENGLTPLIIELNPGSIVAPAAPGGNYTLNPKISVVSSSYLASITGTVAGAPVAGDTISAELTGTNAVIASAPVPSGGAYTLAVPAGVDGTTYDLFVAGVTSFAAKSGVTVTRGVAPPHQNFTVTNASLGGVAGTIIDGRVPSQPISAATVNLLLPPTSSTNCATAPGCVVVATTNSDSVGNYSFSGVPFGVFYVQAQATGTNTVTQQATIDSPTSTCTSSPNASNCSFLMPNTLMTGQVMVDPPPPAGSNTAVLVIAEQSGTGNLVALTQVVVPAGITTPVDFAMEVPTMIDHMPATAFDLIASAQDTYLGVGTPFPGHTLGVAESVPPAGPANPLVVSCVGHGSIVGKANTPLSTTHVRLYKPDVTVPGVQLMDSATGPPGTAGAGQYSFCAPPDTYVLQRVEESQATASPVGTPTMIVVPTPLPAPTVSPTPGPAATPTPCPLCANSAGQCPGNCRATSANPL